MDIAKERLKRMDRRMKRYGLSYTRIPASLPADVQGKYVKYLTGPQKACTYSHIRALQHIVDSNIPVALILEDDAVFRKDWLSVLNTKVAGLQFEDPDWDCVF